MSVLRMGTYEETDCTESAAAVFSRRMGAVLPPVTPDDGSTLISVTPTMRSYLESLIEGHDDPQADALRVLLGLPGALREDVSAGQGQDASNSHILYALWSRFIEDVGVHPDSATADLQGRRYPRRSRRAFDLAA